MDGCGRIWIGALLLGGSLALAALASPRLASAQEADGRLLVALASDARTLGPEARSVGEALHGSLEAGRSRRFPVRLEANRCVAALARAEGSAEGLNVDLLLSRGRTELARDTGHGAVARLLYCAGPRAERLQLLVTSTRGSLRFVAGLYAVPAGTEIVEDPGAGSALDRLGALVEEHAEGMLPVTPPARLMLASGERVQREIPLAPGRCYRILAAADASVVDLDLALIGPQGTLLQEDHGELALATLGVLRPLCPARAGAHRLILRAERGQGAAAFRVLGSAVLAASEASAERRVHRIGGDAEGYLNRQIRARHAAVGEGRLGISPLHQGELRTSQEARFEVEVHSGECYVATAVGMPSARDLDLTLLDAFGHERERERGESAAPALRFCPAVSGHWTLIVRMQAGYGRFAAQVFGGPR